MEPKSTHESKMRQEEEGRKRIKYVVLKKTVTKVEAGFGETNKGRHRDLA